METIQKTIWKSDTAHSEVSFKVKHMMISNVRGHFNDYSATAESEGDDFKNIRFEAKVDSIDTRNSDRDAHLKSDDFFNAAEHPLITFTADELKGDTLTGDLTIRGNTKTVTLDVEFNGIATDPYGQTKAGFTITGKVSRKEFGLTWNAVTEAGNVVVGDAINITIDIQLIKE